MILSAALITVVGMMISSLQETLIKGEINFRGYYHVLISDLNENELEKVSLNKDFTTLAVVEDLGYLSNNLNSYSTLYSMTEKSFSSLSKKILKGRFPKNSNEVVIDDTTNIFCKIEIGDKIKVSAGTLVNFSGEKVNDKYDKNLNLVDKKDYEFTVVGIIEGNNIYITTGVNSNKKDIYLTLKNVFNFKEDIAELLGKSSYDEEKSKYYDNYSINKELLGYETFNISDVGYLSTFSRIAGVIIFIILIISIFSIRNSFAISVTEKTRMYGMLASVGASKKQIKKMVLFEGFLIGVFGIILGIIIGTFISYLLVYIVNMLSQNNFFVASAIGHGNQDITIYFKFSIIPVIIAALVSIIMIYLSVIKCARKASKTSPLQNIRNAEKFKSKKIKLKVPRYINKIFKIGGVISYKNLKRSKKKYRVTIISLTTCVFVFIVVSSLIEYGNKFISEKYVNINYDIMASDITRDRKYFSNEESVNKIRSEAKSYVSYYPVNVNYLGRALLIYDDEYFKFYASQNGINYGDVKDKAIIYNLKKEKDENGKVKYSKFENINVEDKIIFKDTKNNNNLEYIIGGVAEIKPLGYEMAEPLAMQVIVNEKYFSIEHNVVHIYFSSENPLLLEARLREKYEDLTISNISKEASSMKSMLLIATIFIYGFIIVLMLIGVTSVFNTITSNMILRKREFAMLKSIGMTKKEFKNMIYLESFFYSFKSLLVGIILGVVGSYGIYKIFAKSFDYGYIFPLKAVIICTLFVCIIVFIIMRYSMKKINKQNIIETIRNENI